MKNTRGGEGDDYGASCTTGASAGKAKVRFATRFRGQSDSARYYQSMRVADDSGRSGKWVAAVMVTVGLIAAIVSWRFRVMDPAKARPPTTNEQP